MGQQVFVDMSVAPPTADLPTITAITETVLVPTLYTPIPAMEPRATKTYKLTVAGSCTTGTAGTLIVQPRYGTVIGGSSLGVSPTQNYVPSITTAQFVFEFWLFIRSAGQAGTNGTAVGYGWWKSGGAIATAASSTEVGCGTVGAAIAIDTTVASALWIGVTFSVAPSVIPKMALWQPLN